MNLIHKFVLFIMLAFISIPAFAAEPAAPTDTESATTVAQVVANVVAGKELSPGDVQKLMDTMTAKQREQFLTENKLVTEDVVAAKVTAAQNPSTAKVAQEWTELGRGIGDALASGAERIGVVANDFAMSPVGVLTAALIVLHYAGDEVKWLFMVGMSAIFLIVFNFVAWLYSRKFFGLYSDTGKFLRYDPVHWAKNDNAESNWFNSFTTIFCAGNVLGLLGVFGIFS